jgi:hypothetical protein
MCWVRHGERDRAHAVQLGPRRDRALRYQNEGSSESFPGMTRSIGSPLASMGPWPSRISSVSIATGWLSIECFGPAAVKIASKVAPRSETRRANGRDALIR